MVIIIVILKIRRQKDNGTNISDSQSQPPTGPTKQVEIETKQIENNINKPIK
jgi:hypothetical protein